MLRLLDVSYFDGVCLPVSCSLINKSKCHSFAYFNIRWTCVVILHNYYICTVWVAVLHIAKLSPARLWVRPGEGGDVEETG